MAKIKPKKSAKPVNKKLTVKAAPKKAVKKASVKKSTAKKVSVKKALENDKLLNKELNKKTQADIKIPKDLVKFAKFFSENYKKLSYGIYLSDCCKYKIDYLKNLKDTHNGEVLNTPYRVGNTTGKMELSKAKMVKMPPSFIFNSIIWCYLKLKLPMNDYITADIKSIQCSIENGFSKKELVVEYCKVFKGAASQLNVDRVKALTKKFKK